MVGPAYPVKVAQAILRLIVKVCKRRRVNCKIKRLKKIKLIGVRKSVQLSTDPDYSDYVGIIFWYVLRVILTFLYELVLSPLHWFVEFFKGLKTESHMRQVFNRDRAEYLVFKKTLLFAFGLLFSWLVFFFIEFQLDVSRLNSIVLSVSILFVMTIGFTFYSQIQCVILLMLPSLFASNVRYIIVGYIFLLIYTHSLPNIYDNVEIIVDSIVCTVGGTGEAGDSSIDVVRQIFRNIKRWLLEWKQSIMDYLNVFINIGKYIYALFPDLTAMCARSEREAYENCGKGSWFKKAGCSAQQGIYDNVMDVCGEWEKAIDSLKDSIERQYNETAVWVEQQIWFDIDMNHTLQYSYTKSKKYKDIAVDMFDEFFEKHFYFSFFGFISYSNKLILIIVTCWVILNAIIYRNRYLSSDAYDNSYLTEHFFAIDQEREKAEKETLIPLYVSESNYFIDPWDFRMTSIEMRKLTLGLVLFFYSLLHGGFYIGISYLVWYLAVFLRQVMRIIAQLFQKPVVEVESVEKSSNYLVELLSSMATAFSGTFHDYINDCQPNANMPDREFLKRVLTFYLIILLSVFTQAYALRTRHYICGLYYPHRVKERSLWLYHTILCRRGSFVEFTRKKLLRDSKTGVTEEEEDISFLDYICGHFPILRAPLQLLGLYGVYKFCHVCCKRGEVEDMEQFKHCSNDDCKGVYCLDCFAQINNLCTVCMRFIDFKFGDEYSEEFDSSDESDKSSDI